MQASIDIIIGVIFLVEAEFAVQLAIRNANKSGDLVSSIGVLMATPNTIALSPDTVMTGADPAQVAEFAEIVGCTTDEVPEKIAECYKLIDAMPPKRRHDSRKLAICIAFYDGDASAHGKMLLDMNVRLALKEIEEAKK